MDTIKVGQYLAQLRKEKGLTQEQLGEKLGVTNKTVSRWENGNYMPPVDALQQLSELYSLSINELLAGRPLREEEFREEAETNLKAALRSSAFTQQERFSYFRTKWRKEHFFSMTVAMLVIIGAMVLCFLFWKDLLLLPVIAGFGYSISTYNRMMAYIEQHIYPDPDAKKEGTPSQE